MLVAVLSGYLFALFAPAIAWAVKRAAGPLIAALPAFLFAYLLQFVPEAALGRPWRFTSLWDAVSGLEASFRADGLSLLFGLLLSLVAVAALIGTAGIVLGAAARQRLLLALAALFASCLGPRRCRSAGAPRQLLGCGEHFGLPRDHRGGGGGGARPRAPLAHAVAARGSRIPRPFGAPLRRRARRASRRLRPLGPAAERASRARLDRDDRRAQSGADLFHPAARAGASRARGCGVERALHSEPSRPRVPLERSAAVAGAYRARDARRSRPLGRRPDGGRRAAPGHHGLRPRPCDRRDRRHRARARHRCRTRGGIARDRDRRPRGQRAPARHLCGPAMRQSPISAPASFVRL